MSTAIKTETLRALPLFANLTEAECSQLASVAESLEFQTGETVLSQGQTSQNLWVLLDGTCEVFRVTPEKAREEEIVLAELPARSVFGEMSFFHAAPHSASVRAKSRVRLLRFDRAKFDGLLAEGSPSAYKLAVNVVSTLAERVRRMDDWVVELMTRAGKKNEPEWIQLRSKLFGSLDSV